MYKKFFKRFFDITLSFIALVILSPLMLPVAIGLLLTGEHYIFYFQDRVGYKNKPFKIWKFATMLKDSPNLPGGSFTAKKDSRLMPLGSILRKTKVNELPQLVNILKGDMSIVGPRPFMKVSFDAFPTHIQAVIYDEKPGLTGIGSIIFRDEQSLVSKSFQNPEKIYSEQIMPYKGELELWYQEHLTLYTDFMIIFLTAWVIFFPHSGLIHKIFRDLPEKPEFLS